MGSPKAERGRGDNEGPQTEVTLTQSFYMGKYPITQAQWFAVMKSNPSHFSGDDLPVESVSWRDAQNFLDALNTHIEDTRQGPPNMRLPTEAEWEYACRARTSTRFSFGDSLSVRDDCDDDGTRSLHMWYCGNSAGKTQPVGQKLANPWGLHDMHGNVWEWCQDWYAEELPGGSVTDPTGPGSGTYRITRGGAWGDDARNCRSADRSNYRAPTTASEVIGFRVVTIR